MNSNDLQNISNIYQEQVSAQLDELSADLGLRASKEASKRAAILSALGADVPKAVKKAKKFRGQAERFYDYQAKKRRQDSVSEGKKAKPDYLDFDGDGNEKESMKKALKDRNKKSVKEALIGRQSEIDANKNGKIDSQDFKILRSTKKKKIKEEFSNWREDLIEVVGKIENKNGKEPKVVEKEINNTVKINPNLDLGEAIEELGGTLLEMNEIEDFEGVLDDLSESEIFLLSDELIEEVVKEFFYECIQEGYDIQEVENTLIESLEISSAILTEAKVTYGHDTKIKSSKLEKVKGAVKKVGKALVQGAGYAAGSAVRGAKAVGREFKSGYSRGRSGSSSETSDSSDSGSSSTSSQSGSSRPGLLGRIGSALKSGLKRAVAKGARKVAKGALGVARKMEKEKPSSVHSKSGTRSPLTYRGTGSNRKEKISSSTYTPSSKTTSQKKTEPIQDPWEGSATTPSPRPSSQKQQKKGRKLRDRAAEIMADLKREREEEQKAKENVKEDYYDLETKSVKPGKPGNAQKKTIETLAKTATTKKKTRTPAGTVRRGGGSFKPSSPEESEANKKSWGDYWSTAAKGYKEQYEILEKAESEQQQKIFGLALSVKRGQTSRDKVSDKVLKIVDGMSEKKIRDFAKTSHRGLPHKVETKEEVLRQELIARMIEKIEEQSKDFIGEAKLPKSQKKAKNAGKPGYDSQGNPVERTSKTQVIHDVDDNLADQRSKDAAKIDVMRKTGGTWKKVKSLTPSQFAHHNLRKPGEPVKEEKGNPNKEDDPGDKYGFDAFRDTKLFRKTTKPNKPVVRLGDSPRRSAKKSVVTARGGSPFGSNKPSTPMDKPGEFAKDLKTRIGVKGLERKNVHFTGGMRKGSGPEKKGEVVKKIVKSDTKKVITTDDHLQNVRHMASAAKDTNKPVSGPKVRAYQSKPATKAKGKVKPGDIVPVRVGKEGDLKDKNIGIRSNTNPSKSTKETQKRRQRARRGMGESVETSKQKQKQNPSAISRVLKAKQDADSAEKRLSMAQSQAVRSGVNLNSLSS